MKRIRLSRTLFLALALGSALALTAGTTAAADAGGEHGPVTVEYVNPHKFAESGSAGWATRYDHDNYLQKLKAYLQHKAAPLLAPGQQLAIRITDVDLAGGYEPWLKPGMDDVRIMRDIYPPRINLSFTLTDATGQVIRSGDRKLVGLGYLHSQPGRLRDTDPLRYDKGLLNRWLRRGPADW